MGRGPKPVKGKAKPAVARKSPKNDAARVRGLEKRLAEALRDKAEVLDQQTATSEILRVISSSPTDVQPVFNTIASTAARLCESFDSIIWRLGDNRLVDIAHHGPIPIEPGGLPLSRESVPGRAALEGKTFHLTDLQALANEFPIGSDLARRNGFRTVLNVPLMRDAAAIGVITVRRTEIRPFTERQIALLKTFADQAVIAIENVRLFTETKEALEQQTATAEILRVISESPTDIRPVFAAVLDRALALCEASNGSIYQLEDGTLRHVGLRGPHLGIAVGDVVPLESSPGRAILEKRTLHLEDVLQELDWHAPEVQEGVRRAGLRTTVSVPLLREQTAIGAIVVRRLEVRPFSEKQIRLLQTFADQAVIAIENVRLFNELQEKNKALTQAHAQVSEALDQQTATSEILRVISRSQADARPVFESIAENAMRLFRAWAVQVYRLQDQELHLEAARGGRRGLTLPEWAVEHEVSRASYRGRSILDRAIIHVRDVLSDPKATDRAREWARADGWRSVINAPMLRDGAPIGLITVYRLEPGGFSPTEVELLKTFADQAVIAVENVRLFTELEEKNKALTQAHAQVSEALDQQTATSEILRVISGSPRDVQPVFETILANASRLCEATFAAVFLYDGEALAIAAHQNASPQFIDYFTRTRLFPSLDGPSRRAALQRRPVHVHDLLTDPTFKPLALHTTENARTVLSVPLLRGNQLIGVVTIWRREARPFTSEQVALLKTFADQAVIAIENVRLFKELEGANRELSAASQHKSEFLANMSHELRTPLNAIIGFSEVLTDRMFGELNEKQEEYLKDIYASGTHLLSLINDILDLSKIEAGRMELELTEFDLPTAIENALMLVRERAGRRSIALHTNIDNRLALIQADERKVRQVVLNLLSNAIKFTPEGGRIEVGAVPKDGFVEVSVTDTGIGIAPEDQEAVFEEFRQVGTAEKKAEGTGLGLTLCRKFIELHGGRIWVKSEVDVGSTFTFMIPVRAGE